MADQPPTDSVTESGGLDVTKVNGKWYERRWHWTGTKADAGLGYSLRPLSALEAERAERRTRA